jgi:hypothetical protein
LRSAGLSEYGVEGFLPSEKTAGITANWLPQDDETTSQAASTGSEAGGGQVFYGFAKPDGSFTLPADRRAALRKFSY